MISRQELSSFAYGATLTTMAWTGIEFVADSGMVQAIGHKISSTDCGYLQETDITQSTELLATTLLDLTGNASTRSSVVFSDPTSTATKIKHDAALSAGLTMPSNVDAILPAVSFDMQEVPHSGVPGPLKMLGVDLVQTIIDIVDSDDIILENNPSIRAQAVEGIRDYYQSNPIEVTQPEKVTTIHVVNSIERDEVTAIRGVARVGIDNTSMIITSDAAIEHANHVISHESAHLLTHQKQATVTPPCEFPMQDKNDKHVTEYAATKPSEDWADTLARTYDPVVSFATVNEIAAEYTSLGIYDADTILEDPRIGKMAVATAFYALDAPGFMEYTKDAFETCATLEYAQCAAVSVD